MSEWFSRQALGSLPADAARRWSAREALAFQGRRWTFAELSGPVNYLGTVRQLAPSRETARAGEVREARFPRWKRVVVAAAEPRPEMLDWRALVQAGEQVDDVDLRNRAAAVDPEAAAFIMYTSGTTGFPKGAMHCHRIVRNLVDRAF